MQQAESSESGPVSPDVPRDPIRIFISSPSDVAPERAAALRAIALLNRRYADTLRLEGVFWEDYFFPATADFQTWINRQTPPWNCDLVVCILWSRIGSPLSDTWPRREDGSRYESGTVAEFELTLPYAQKGAPPDLYTFVKTAPTTERGATEKQRAAQAQAVVEQVVHRWFHQAEAVAAPGAAAAVHPFTAGYNPFETTDAFENLFARFLEWWLQEKGRIDRQLSWDLHERGLPYVGLAPFTSTHSAVFFGRDADRRVCRRLLAEADDAGFPYLLIVGGSGVGKSSLARAGLVSDICFVTQDEAWCSSVLLAGAAPMRLLADSLFAVPELGAELVRSLLPDAPTLARALAADTVVAVAVVTRALDAMAATLAAERSYSKPPTGRLLLVLDQTEALLEAEAEAQGQLVAVLAALVATRRVWLVATLRADRIAALLAAPVLAPLVTRVLTGEAAVGAEYKLTAPDAAAIRDIVEAPAVAAGLRFEQRGDGRSLADEVRAEVEGQRDALPLLQHLLVRLFRNERLARWAEYEAIGGLSGAIAAVADAAVARLEAPARAELRPLLLALVADFPAAVNTASASVCRP